MSGIQFVERPAVRGKDSKYSDYYEALHATLVNGQAIKTSLARKEVNAVRMCFQGKHDGVRVRCRTLPDGLYMWAERIEKPAALVAV